MVHLALYCPEIPQNTGTLVRYASCMGVPLHIIHPCGFFFSDKRFQRSVMDYMALCSLHHHDSWSHFLKAMSPKRLVLATLDASVAYHSYGFYENDCIVMGQESAGFPAEILQEQHHRVHIPMIKGVRSMNMALAAGIITSEALRQMGGPPLIR